MLNLRVETEPNSGFCFGVKNAIRKAEEVLSRGEELYCLGELVHNEKEIMRLQQKGMKIISYEEYRTMQDKTVLFRAHGEPPESYTIALKNNIRIIDASCPIILKLQERIYQSWINKEKIYIFGLPNHPEIIGLNGKIFNNAVIFKDFKELDLSNIPNEITLYSQTTGSLKKFYEIIDKLEAVGIRVHVVDSICRQVSNRESELREFCRRFDCIIFVAGKNSSNGKRLFEMCKEENAKSYFISTIEEIDLTWFRSAERIGVSGATSTPLWLIEKVRDYLLSV
ncbi:MAG: 4-hydroxy-3-methylbut-2-enyl diphosphate reductase [Bacteroidales bacterium]|jgi:4-hydroxy-3-methylbut-2-enyl diphosphate reductase|nr:4-hydroxy-3-methylbut-2-enyl diphosphate reductase [Bacteroidales bacterium]MDD4214669.1 4-hydroxy-3-methylbut-2-enyl diphosphate reductase [Bacteroidales bacterium]